MCSLLSVGCRSCPLSVVRSQLQRTTDNGPRTSDETNKKSPRPDASVRHRALWIIAVSDLRWIPFNVEKSLAQVVAQLQQKNSRSKKTPATTQKSRRSAVFMLKKTTNGVPGRQLIRRAGAHGTLLARLSGSWLSGTVGDVLRTFFPTERRLVRRVHAGLLGAAERYELTVNLRMARLPGRTGCVVDNQPRYTTDDDIADDPWIHRGTKRDFRWRISGRLDSGHISRRKEEPTIALQGNHTRSIERGDLSTLVIVHHNMGIRRITVEGNFRLSAADNGRAAGKQRARGKYRPLDKRSFHSMFVGG